MDRTLYRGDDYVIRRQVFHLELIDPDAATELDPVPPFDMTGCSVRVTFKVTPTDPELDPDDSTAPIRGDITFDASGNVTGANLLTLPDRATAADGVLDLTMTRDDTLRLRVGEKLAGDAQVTTIDDEDLTVPLLVSISAVDGYTNRRGA